MQILEMSFYVRKFIVASCFIVFSINYIDQRDVIVPCAEPQCDGSLTSDNYPFNYPKLRNDNTTLCVPSGKIKINWTDFSLEQPEHTGYGVECVYDWIKIVECENQEILLNKTCGRNLTLPTLTSNTNCIKIIFRTDGNWQFRGWYFTWNAVVGNNGNCEI
eukprot:GFUD01129909.1.p1 GENE.GFUD01129909.1~~GFUD01129909.1.p1  ORF type:complete len:161 (-),score=30.05 GFUD01129909.1:164-646(-)